MDTKQTIPVFFTFNSNYLLAANVTLHSMLRHASRSYRYDLYVFHSALNAGHRHTLEKCLERASGEKIRGIITIPPVAAHHLIYKIRTW